MTRLCMLTTAKLSYAIRLHFFYYKSCINFRKKNCVPGFSFISDISQLIKLDVSLICFNTELTELTKKVMFSVSFDDCAKKTMLIKRIY